MHGNRTRSEYGRRLTAAFIATSRLLSKASNGTNQRTRLFFKPDRLPGILVGAFLRTLATTPVASAGWCLYSWSGRLMGYDGMSSWSVDRSVSHGDCFLQKGVSKQTCFIYLQKHEVIAQVFVDNVATIGCELWYQVSRHPNHTIESWIWMHDPSWRRILLMRLCRGLLPRHFGRGGHIPRWAFQGCALQWPHAHRGVWIM